MGRIDERLVKWEEGVGSKRGPRGRGVEGLVDSANEEDRLEIGISARFGVIMGELFQVRVSKVSNDDDEERTRIP